MKAVEEFAALGAEAKAGLLEKFGIEAGLRRSLGQCVAALGGKTKPKLADDVVAKAARPQISHTKSHAIYVFAQCAFKEFARPLVQHQHGRPFALCTAFVGVHLALLDGNAVLGGQPAQGFGIGHVLVLHNEVDHVAAFAAGEALAKLFGRRYHKTRRTLVVEWAQTLIVHSRLAQCDKLLDHLDNVRGVQDALYGLAVNHGNTW